MPILGSIVLSIFAAVLASALAVGLWRMIRALRAGDAPQARRFLLPFLRLSLWLAGAVVLVVSQGRGYRVALLMSIGAMLLNLPRDWAVLRSSQGPHRGGPAA